MTAETIVHALGSSQSRGGWWRVKCPICHADRLGLKDGDRGLVVNCYRNSGEPSCSRVDILTALQQLGHYDPDADKPIEPDPEELARRAEAEAVDRQRRIAKEKWLWQEETYPATDTPAHTYLHSRGVYFKTVPEAIRFHPSLYHTKSHEYRPAMVVKINLDCPGGATLSKDGIKSLVLPPSADMVLVAADHDRNGTGPHAAKWAARRWMAEDKRVKIALPPAPGVDWNDILLAGRLDGRRYRAA